MRLGNLALHLGLVTLLVEGGTEGTGVGGLESIVAHDADVASISIVEYVIDTRRPQIFLIDIGRCGAELVRARNVRAQSGEVLTAPAGYCSCTSSSRSAV